MKGLTGKFSLRELLQIILPGTYFIILLKPICVRLNLFNILNSSSEVEIIILSLLSLLVGMIVYSIDIPKKICFFKKNLPTTLIEENLSNIDDVHNKFFQFYDDKISEKEKTITEKYTSIYHFAVNLFITSGILLVLYIVAYRSAFFNSFGLLVLIILILSFLLALLIFYGDKKIKYMFLRQYEKFEKNINS